MCSWPRSGAGSPARSSGRSTAGGATSTAWRSTPATGGAGSPVPWWPRWKSGWPARESGASRRWWKGIIPTRWASGRPWGTGRTAASSATSAPFDLSGRRPRGKCTTIGATQMAKVDVTVYYLEMRSHQRRDVPPPREGLSVVHARQPTVAYYRFLYNTVGRDYHWSSRAKLADAELAAVLQNPRNEVYVLLADGTPAGFAELDRSAEGEIELIQFGLMPEFIGQGLGKYFLQWTIDKAWSYGPSRFWLHTCTKDHPAALPNYLKAGFSVYKEEVKDQG